MTRAGFGGERGRRHCCATTAHQQRISSAWVGAVVAEYLYNKSFIDGQVEMFVRCTEGEPSSGIGNHRRQIYGGNTSHALPAMAERRSHLRPAYVITRARRNIHLPKHECSTSEWIHHAKNRCRAQSSHQCQVGKLNSLVFFARYDHDPSTGVCVWGLATATAAGTNELLLPSVAVDGTVKHVVSER